MLIHAALKSLYILKQLASLEQQCQMLDSKCISVELMCGSLNIANMSCIKVAILGLIYVLFWGFIDTRLYDFQVQRHVKMPLYATAPLALTLRGLFELPNTIYNQLLMFLSGADITCIGEFDLEDPVQHFHE